MSHYRNALFLFAVVSLAAGCGSSDPPPPFDDVDVAGREANPDGLAYPTNDLGGTPRNKTTPGKRFPNLSFQGYPDSDRSNGLQVVSMADSFDPDQKRNKLMHFVGAVVWCPHCQAETRAMAASDAGLRAKGVVTVETLMEGPDGDRPLSLVDLDDWVADMHTNFTVLIDVEGRRLGSVASLEGVPWNALIDTRTMEILDVTVGEVTDLSAYIDSGLTWVASNGPRP